MNNSDNVYFDIFQFSYADSIREINIYLNGDLLKISEIRVGKSDIWIVPGDSLIGALKGNYKNGYPMFFGILLADLNKHGTAMPICGICLGDVDRALGANKANLHLLAEQIAKGAYRQSRSLGGD